MTKEACIPCLFSVFRQYGYDGATLAKLSAATGLGKASLYHHFPGGKDDMVNAVLGYAENWLQENVLQLLASEGSPQERLQNMCDRVNDLYGGGTQPCLLAILQAGTGRSVFHDDIKGALTAWIGAIATVLGEAGIEPSMAQQLSEDALIAIQGALMVSQALDNPRIFQRTLQMLPQQLS
ncbi:MAG: TetR/AcrR family transcriptional regulator [Leptolyngbyaceae bacterium]|nr:TetR/AcrR family transcriptional regulator [Leptolyngbyaceae bacterium]